MGLKSFKDSFKLYRGKLKSFSKLLNKLHLNIVSIFSEIEGKNPSEIKNLLELFKILKSFYKENQSNKQLISDFKKAKIIEIEIHQIITRIFSNLSKFTFEVSDLLLREEKIFDDLIEYIDKNTGSHENLENFIKKIIDKDKKKKNYDRVKKIVLNVAENTCQGIRNLFFKGIKSDSFSHYMNYVK